MDPEDKSTGTPNSNNFTLLIAIGEGTALAISTVDGFSSREAGLAASEIIIADLQRREEGYALQASTKDGFRKVRVSCFEKK